MHDDSRVEIGYINRNNHRICCRHFSALDSKFAIATAKENEKLPVSNGCKLFNNHKIKFLSFINCFEF
jgi:hypothetical protein